MTKRGASPVPDGTLEVTGNHHLSFPAIDRDGGAIGRIGALHGGLRCLLEWSAGRDPARRPAALLVPLVRVDGQEAPLHELAWERLDRWIPAFRGQPAEGLRVEGVLCAPPGLDSSVPGAILRFRLHNAHDVERPVELALEGCWTWTLGTVRTARPLPGANRLVRTGGALVMAAEPAALALAAGPAAYHAAAVGEAGPEPLEDGDERSASQGTPISFRIGERLAVPARGSADVVFYIGVAPERDGAAATTAYLRELGAEALLRQSRLDLARLARSASTPQLATLLNRNLLFNYFFALGRGVDDDRLYPVPSRSSLHDGPAVVRERDALLWSLPALLLVDHELAREALIRAFEQYSHHPGQRGRYLDGGVLEPGFALDQLCAYILALDRYIQETGDSALLDLPLVQEVLRELEAELGRRLHPEVLLCSTEYLPSGDRPRHPYAIFANALLRACCEAMPRLWIASGDADRSHFAGAGEEVAAAVWRYGTVEVDGLRVLAGTTDLRGEAAVYDDPAGSIGWLPALGFCDADDPIWRNTMEFLHSGRYRFWLGERPHPGLAGRRHPGEASLAALCAELVGAEPDAALERLRRLPLDDGLACETYDPDTGRPVRGRHHAALAGLLAWSLWQALESR